MTSHRITLLAGDGIGPEITAVATELLDAVSRRHGFQLEYDEQPMGGSAIDATGEPLPASTLAACGASAAAFRLAVEQPSPMGETTVIAWALALIGVICVGVSSWNLYVRWGKPD
jgi:isocitrate/isopropylmalate dehydrogenase